MKGKLLQKLIAVVLVMCMTLTNFIFVATSTVYALSATTQLEGGNIVFEAYFKNDNEKVTQKSASIKEGESLFVALELKAGKLQEAKIKIDNANFKIVDDKVSSKFINSINTKTNEIVLNEISYNDSKNGVIEIELPIKFEEAQTINTSYFEMENSISLSGKYINSSEIGKTINSDPISTKLRWTESTVKVGWNGSIEKIIALDDKVLVQAEIESTYKDLYFPKESEKVTISVPKVKGITPSYVVLADGEKLDTSKITDNITTQNITFVNDFKDGENIKWNKLGNTYKVIYVYDGITSLEEPLELKATVETKIFNRDAMTSEELNFDSKVLEGTISSVTAKSTSDNIYKGFMYANSNKTTYSEEYKIEMSYVNNLSTVFELQEDNFKTENAGTITTNNKTEYNKITINKENLIKILGDKGTLKLIPDNKSLSEITINKSTSADENGNIVIDYEKIKDSHNITVEVVSAQNEGTLKLAVEKSILGNAGYDKETLKTINAIETTVKSYTKGIEGQSTATATTQLKETVTEATLTMNNNNVLSTTTQNDIEFIATLKTGTMDTDLLKAPTVKIVLPEEVAKTELTSVSALYAEEELKIASSEVIEDGKAILVKLDGEQFNYNNKLVEGIKLTINAKITLKESAISRETKIEMKYTNENSVENEYTASTPVSIQAPYGVITKTVLNAEFENQNKGTQTIATSIVNNYEKSIESIAIIGTMPKIEVSREDFEKTIKDSFKTTVNDVNVKVEYSKDEENFDENFENAKLYKVIVENSKLESGEKITLTFKMDVAQILTNYKLAFVSDGSEQVQNLKIDKITSNLGDIEFKDLDEENKEPSEAKDPLQFTAVARTANNEVKDKDEVVEGQVIRYTYTLTNNTNKDMTNIKFTANHENVNVFEYKTEEQPDSLNPGHNTNFTIEKEIDGKSNFEYEIETLGAGQTRRITYQVRVKEDADQISNNAKVTGEDVEEKTIQTSNPVKEAQLKLELSSNVAQEYPVAKDLIFSTDFIVKNISDEKLENITVSYTIPKSFEYEDINEVEPTNNYTVIQKDKNILIFNIKELAPGAQKVMTVSLKAITDNEKKKTEFLKYSAVVNNKIYYSNESTVGVIARNNTNFEASQTTNVDTDTLKTGDNLIYTIKIKNVSDIKDVVMVSDNVPEAAVINKAYYTKGNETNQISEIANNTVTEHISLDAGEEASLNIETTVDESKTGKEEITNYATVIGNYTEKAIKTNEVTHKLQANIKEDSKKSEDGSQSEAEGTDSIVDGTSKDAKLESKVDIKQSISGVAWIDENKNGVRENTEKTLSGIKVSIANVETGKYVTDSNGDKIEITTNTNGEYKFENISNGKYIVVFTYDNTKYRNTEYRASSATDKTNSDIITSKLSTSNDDINYGVTDTLELNDESLENIDAGFIENEIFDLNLNKYVTKITVQNSSGTVVKQYSNEQLAKIEIDSRNLAGSTVLVEYTIEVKNEGEIAGYANEIVDYIPKDLTFNSQMNKQWYTSTDGNLHTTALAKELINPGESKTITLILTKTMTENNTGLTSNKAEIAKSSNELSVPDKDSKAGNSIQTEDDISTAEMIISIRTGLEFTIGIIIAIIAVTATGIIIYTKKRKEVSHE